MRVKTLVGLWLPVTLWALLIFYMSSRPATSIPQYGYLVQKGAHVGEYAVLAVLLLRAWLGHGFSLRVGAILAWLGAILFASSDEFHQIFTLGRNGTPVDVGIDAIGAALGIGVVAGFCLHRRRPGQRDRAE
ncbi:MAG: VanZ family protein [Chloroflexota bacterium]